MFKLSDLFKRPGKEELIKIGRYFAIGICQIALVVFVLCIYDSYHNTRIGVVNITGIADEFIKTQSRSGVSAEELKKRVQIFGAALEKTSHDVGAKKHVVLMPAEAVITGAKDYTQEVQRRLFQIIQKLPQEQSQQQSVQQPQQQLSQETKQPITQAPSLEQQSLLQGATQAATDGLQETNQVELSRKVSAAQ